MTSARDAAQYVLNERRNVGRFRQSRKLGHRMLDRSQCAREGIPRDLQCQGRRPQTYGLVEVLEDDGVLSGSVAGARSSIADIVSDHALQFQGDVLDDVAKVGSALQPYDKPAGLPDAAPVVSQSRHRRHESLGQSGNISRGDVLVSADVQVHPGYRALRPVVRSARGVEGCHPDFGFRIWNPLLHYRSPSAEYFRTRSRLAATSSARITTRSLSFICCIA